MCHLLTQKLSDFGYTHAHCMLISRLLQLRMYMGCAYLDIQECHSLTVNERCECQWLSAF